MKRRSFIGMLTAAALAPISTIKSALTSPQIDPLGCVFYARSPVHLFETLCRVEELPEGRHILKRSSWSRVEGVYGYERILFDDIKEGCEFCILDVTAGDDNHIIELQSPVVALSPATDGVVCTFPLSRYTSTHRQIS